MKSLRRVGAGRVVRAYIHDHDLDLATTSKERRFATRSREKDDSNPKNQRLVSRFCLELYPSPDPSSRLFLSVKNTRSRAALPIFILYKRIHSDDNTELHDDAWWLRYVVPFSSASSFQLIFVCTECNHLDVFPSFIYSPCVHPAVILKKVVFEKWREFTARDRWWIKVHKQPIRFELFNSLILKLFRSSSRLNLKPMRFHACNTKKTLDLDSSYAVGLVSRRNFEILSLRGRAFFWWIPSSAL